MRTLGPLFAFMLPCLFFAATSICAQSPLPATPTISSASASTDAATAPGNEACAKCHEKIFATFSAMPMGKASGPATQDFLPGEFHDAVSGIQYHVYLENGEVWLSFDRNSDPPLHGKRKLDYFIGSGHRGKTFIFSDDGFAFESPINFYTGAGAAPGGQWDMTPKYQGAKEMPMTLAVSPICLNCHTSDAQFPQVGTENKYASPLFAHGGITCERCHGSDVSHGMKSRKSEKTSKWGFNEDISVHAGAINPAKLNPARRDAVCMQCHLEGNAAIEQPGRHLYQFRAGDDLSQFMHYYVLTGDGKENVRAVSQFEALSQSACKRAAGDAMTCITCHDPHSSPKPAERPAYYRAKCLTCHGQTFAAKHHSEQNDCTSCHMPRVEAVDVAHTQDSDHRILRLPFQHKQDSGQASESGQNLSTEPRLTQFPVSNGPESSRDLALAWTTMATKGSQIAAMQVEKFLPQALAQSPEDPELLAALGFDEQNRGLIDQARQHYEHALRVKPLALDAAANLALIEANAGNLDRAVALWKPAFARAPGKSAWGINLARALCLTGHGEESKATIARVLEFNPDSATARGMLKQLETGEVKCDAE